MSELSTERSHSLTPQAESAPATESGCPTPLAWQEVRQAVCAESRNCTAQVGSVCLSATLFGTGDPLYFLPGFVGDHELFVLVSWLLREEKCCVMLDPPRMQIASPETLKHCGQALLKLADQLGHGPFRVHATSLGSLVALQTMLNDPERLAEASLHCGFAGWKLTLFERLLAHVGLRSSKSLGELRSAVRLQTTNHRCWFPPFDGSRWDFYLQNVSATPVAEIARRALMANAVDLKVKLDCISTPILLIGCEGDGRVSRTAQKTLAESLPHCEMAFLDNCGRLPHVTHPHRLVKLLRAFWEENA